MKRKQIKNRATKLPVTRRKPSTAFELLMNYQSDMRESLGLAPLPHWGKTIPTPNWVKNIYQNFRRTIFKSLCKLKPKRRVNWRYYGRIIGIGERCKTFLTDDVSAILKREGLNKIGKRQWAKIEPLLGLDIAREYYLKVFNFPRDSILPFERLVEMEIHKQLLVLERTRQAAFSHLVGQNAKTVDLFLQGMREGYIAFLNGDGEFSGDDRRADIHLELLAWQYDIEKMRRAVPQKYNKHLTAELQNLPRFERRSDSWFNDVYKDIKLTIGKKGRPPIFCEA